MVRFIVQVSDAAGMGRYSTPEGHHRLFTVIAADSEATAEKAVAYLMAERFGVDVWLTSCDCCGPDFSVYAKRYETGDALRATEYGYVRLDY